MERPHPLHETQAIARNLPETAQLFAGYPIAHRAFARDVWPDSVAKTGADVALDVLRTWRMGLSSDGDRKMWRSLTFINTRAAAPKEEAQQAALLCIVSALDPYTPMECLEHSLTIAKWEKRPTRAWDDGLWPEILAEEEWLYRYICKVSLFCSACPMPAYPRGTQGFSEWLRRFPIGPT